MTKTFRAISEYAWPRFRDTIGAGLVVLVVWSLIQFIGPRIEARWFPVVSDATIYDTAVNVADVYMFRYRFIKHRDCDLKSYAWYYIDKDSIGPADITRDGPTPSRPTGVNLSVWWRVGSGEKLPGDYFIDMRYDCGWPWASKSTLGPLRLTRPAS